MGYQETVIQESFINEDGTPWNDGRPVNPLEEKWNRECRVAKNGSLCMPVINEDLQTNGYSCVFCSEAKCRYNSRWTIPEEDKKAYDAYRNEVKEYEKIHNPQLYELIYG